MKKFGTFPIWSIKFIKWIFKKILKKNVKLYGRGSRINCSNSHRDLYWRRAKKVAIYIK